MTVETTIPDGLLTSLEMALKPFAAMKLETYDCGLPLKIGVMNGNMSQSIHEATFDGADFATARAAIELIREARKS